MKNLLISFSGGRTSAFMTKLILELPKYKDYNKLVVFANTGKENEQTLEFINRCDIEFNLNVHWIEALITQEKGIGTKYSEVDYKTADRTGGVFEDLIRKYGIPNKAYRHCTRDLKEIPIHKFAKDYFKDKYLTAIGIRADEKHRLGSKPDIIYPLADMGFTQEIIINWWDRQDFDLELKDYQGNCDLCFLKSIRKKMTLLTEREYDWWIEMERKYGTTKLPRFDVYRKKTVLELIEDSKRKFRKAIDKKELMKNQFSFELDTEFDCFCKSN